MDASETKVSEAAEEEEESNVVTEETIEEEQPIAIVAEKVYETRTTIFPAIHDAHLQDGIGFNQNIVRLQEGFRTSYLMFDLSPIDSIGGSVNTTDLEFTIDTDNGDGSISIFRAISNDWTEEKLSAKSAPETEFLMGELDTRYDVGQTLGIALDTAFVKNELLTLVMTHEQGNDLAFASKEHPNGKGPALVVSYSAPQDAEAIVFDDEVEKELEAEIATAETKTATEDTVEENTSNEASTNSDEGATEEEVTEAETTEENAAEEESTDEETTEENVAVEETTDEEATEDNTTEEETINEEAIEEEPTEETEVESTVEEVTEEATTEETEEKVQDAETSEEESIEEAVAEEKATEEEIKEQATEESASTAEEIDNEADAPINESPIAVAEASPTSGDAPLEVSFKGSSSRDDLGVKQYRWDFRDGSTSTEANPTHTFEKTGTLAVRLTVTDDQGASHTDTVTITITEEQKVNEAPVAAPKASIASGEAPLNVQFTGDESTDDNEITKYSWDFKDGSEANTANPSHTFTEAGTYEVVLTVSDEDGAENSRIVKVTVNEAKNEEPVALPKASTASGEAPLNVQFTGDESTDDNEIISTAGISKMVAKPIRQTHRILLKNPANIR